MGDVRLRCGVYGEGTVFPVTIARDAKVENLQKAIFEDQRYRERFSFPPNDLTLYLAKKDGAWLKDDDDVEEFLRGEVDKTYRKMLSSRRLNKVDYFGKDFEPGEEEIHILVQLPPAAAPSLTSTSVKMDDDAEQLTAPYEQAAERLKDDPTVSQLVAAVHYVAEDTQARPFIVLESSSGMGKTQMAFNLMARDDIETHYVVCEGGAGFQFRQPVYVAFDSRAVTFLECIERDLKLGIGHGEVMRGPMGLRLHTFEFVRALLSGADKLASDMCAYEDVREVLENQTKQPVVFIDEFPLLDEDKQNEVKLRFMRNVFRSLQLPAILSATHGTARSLGEGDAGTGMSRIATDVRWCVVVPELPRFQDPATTSLARRDMAALVDHSRPLFARSALDYMRDHEPPSQSEDDLETIKYMDGLMRDLEDKCRQWKASWLAWFSAGQVGLFVSGDVYKSSETSARLIHGHFARLQDPKMFELRLGDPEAPDKWDLEQARDGGLVVKMPPNAEPWRVRTVFPTIDHDVLLYLSLLGGKHHPAFRDVRWERISFHEALEEVETQSPGLFDFKDPHQRLEAMTVAAIMSASHCNGFAGIPLDAFLLEMMYELGMGRPMSEEDWCRVMPASFRSLQMPFLAPLDTQWPAWLPSALKLGTIARAVDVGGVGWRIDDGWLTCECMDGEGDLDVDGMKKIMERVQPSCAVHVVVTNQQLQAAYFAEESLEEYVRAQCPHLTNTLFLQCGTAGRVRPVTGMERPVASADRLVLIVVRPPPPADEGCELAVGVELGDELEGESEEVSESEGESEEVSESEGDDDGENLGANRQGNKRRRTGVD